MRIGALAPDSRPDSTRISAICGGSARFHLTSSCCHRRTLLDVAAIAGVFAAYHDPEPLAGLHAEAIRVAKQFETVDRLSGRVHGHANSVRCARKNSAVALAVLSMSSVVCAAVMYPRSM